MTAILLRGPDPEVDGVSIWRPTDPCRIVRERLGGSRDESGLGKRLHRRDLCWQTPRPQHVETGRAAWNSLIAEAGRIRCRVDAAWARQVSA